MGEIKEVGRVKLKYDKKGNLDFRSHTLQELDAISILHNVGFEFTAHGKKHSMRIN